MSSVDELVAAIVFDCPGSVGSLRELADMALEAERLREALELIASRHTSSAGVPGVDADIANGALRKSPESTA